MVLTLFQQAINMDKNDLKILSLLQQDANQSIGDIAEQVGISKSSCWRRVKSLEANNVIRGSYTILNPEKVNLPLMVYISIKTDQHNQRWYQQFKKVTDSLPQVLEVHRMTGDLDYLIKAVVTDMRGYDQLYKELVQVSFTDVSAAFVMEHLKQTTELPLDYAAAL